MRIVIFRHSLLSRGGDKMIAAHASHLAEQGHDVVIRTNRVDTVMRLHPAVRIEQLRVFGKGGTLLSALCEKQRADLVIADIIPLVCLLRVRNGGRVVYFAQDYDESYYASAWQKFSIRLLYAVGLGLLRVKTVAVSRALAELLQRRFRARACVVENGVDTSIFYHDPVPELVAGKEGRKAILVLSRSDHRKGFDIALSVIARLGSVAGDVEVWTVGESAAGRFQGLRHRDFGYLKEERLRQVMSSADMMLYPSRHEGFPLMVLEAFACRCAVVTTEAVPYAAHGVNALVAGIEDTERLTALTKELLAGDGTRRSLAEKGFRFAAAHSLAASLRAFEGRLIEMGGRDAAS